VILPDLNLLLYAYNPHSIQHSVALKWWSDAINGQEVIGLPHEIMLGFIRISTHPKMGPAAVKLLKARQVVETWLDMTHVKILIPQTDHSMKVITLLEKCHGSGTLTSDASLAVYAMENRATLYSNDSDFSRFNGLKWINPLESP
jgi:hypothetical protein